MTDDQHDQLPTAVVPAPAQVDTAGDLAPSGGEASADGTESIGDPSVRAAQKRRRGSRGGRNRKRPAGAATGGAAANGDAEGSESLGNFKRDQAFRLVKTKVIA